MIAMMFITIVVLIVAVIAILTTTDPFDPDDEEDFPETSFKSDERTKEGLTLEEAEDAVLYKMGGMFTVAEYTSTDNINYGLSVCAEHREWLKTLDDPVLKKAYDKWLSHWERNYNKELRMRESGERARKNAEWEEYKRKASEHGATAMNNANKIPGP